LTSAVICSATASEPPMSRTPFRQAQPHAPACGSISRRAALRSLGAATLGLSVGACAARSSTPRVVLYSSVDDHLLRALVPLYEAATGVTVDVVGDTEATKNTGLAERLIAERSRPRGDVWWSSEPFYSIRLAREGLLEPGAARAALGDETASLWPTGLLASDGSWAGLACRARVIVYRASRVPEAQVPRRLDALTDPTWRGRVAMARPEFGTTRGHLAALIQQHGPEATESWLRALKANALKVYSGNSTVVRAVAQGEADLGLTDTDDVWSGQRNGWDVEAAYESDAGAGAGAGNRAIDRGSERSGASDATHTTPTTSPEAPTATPPTPEAPIAQGGDWWHGALASPGPLVLPNTVGLIKGGPNPTEGRRLLAWILGGEAERFLARSESRNMPVRADVVSDFPDLRLASAWRPHLEHVPTHLDAAATIAARVLDS